MTEEFVVYAIRSGLISLLKIAIPMLGVALVVGLIVSIFQAATQIQDNILGYLPKMIVIVLIIAFGFSYGYRILIEYLFELFSRIPEVI